ncbi:MAG: hypothetical protein JW807_02490 [Spirochaetes bacterium]|nr:hypothetical protein [Spirochaetota bacterium]
MAEKGYFVDFVADAAKDYKMGKSLIEYLKKTTNAAKLSKWFASKGYLVSKDDCAKLIKNKKGIVNIKEQSVKFAY